MRGRGWLVPTLLLLVVAPIGWAVYTAVQADDGTPERPDLSRDGSEEVDVDDGTPPLAITGEPDSYELTYHVERYDPDRVVVSEDRLAIRRPFDGRVTGLIDGRVVADRASRFGALVITTGEGPRTLVSPPAPATGDLRLAPALADAVEEGWVEVRERRRVVGQLCQVYRFGSTVSSGVLTPMNSTAGERSDVCIDARGLLLEEVWFKDGVPLQRRVATKRTIDPELPDSRFSLGDDEQPLTMEQGNGFLREVDAASAYEGTVYRLTTPPEGATYLGRYVVQPPTLSPFRSPLDSETEKREQVSLIDVWAQGRDLLVFSQTIAADISAVPADAKTARPFELGPVGAAATILDLRSSEVRAELPEARFLRIAGTFTRQRLLELAAGLRAEEGTGLVFLDP